MHLFLISSKPLHNNPKSNFSDSRLHPINISSSQRLIFLCFPFLNNKAYYYNMNHRGAWLAQFAQCSEVKSFQKPGKVSLAVLPAEHTLLRFVSNLTHLRVSWILSIPACSWDGVRCDNLANVHALQWTNFHLRGEPNWHFLPHTLKRLYLGSISNWNSKSLSEIRALDPLKYFSSRSPNQLSGSILTEALPNELQLFEASDNVFRGALCLLQLPHSLVRLNVEQNDLSGSLDFSHLPVVLESLTFSENSFSGSLDLSRLPASLVELTGDDNRFNGPLNLSLLPDRLQFLFLGGNMLSGHLDVSRLPCSVLKIYLPGNEFTSWNPNSLPECVIL